jgi:sensor c-di-GMP phosphodiesterase-like protein
LQPSGRQKVIGAIVGVLFAGVGFFAFNYWLDSICQAQMQEDLRVLGERKLGIMETRIGQAIDVLDDLARQGVESCRSAQVETLRQTVLSIALIREISIIGADGQTRCTSFGPATGTRSVVASQQIPSASNLWIDVISLGDGKDNMVRIRRMGDGNANGLGAIILGSQFVSHRNRQENMSDGYGRATLQDGTLMGEAGSAAGTDAAPVDMLTATFQSARYGIKLNTSIARSALPNNAAGLRALGMMVAAALAAIMLILSYLMSRRERDNPIAELDRALKAGEFVPYYQPVVDLVSGKLRGAEVLIRWRKPDGTIVSPAIFIPLAESSGIILDMTRALMRRVCQEAGAAFAQRPHMKISFNLAARHFEDETILSDVQEIFGRGPIRLSQVVLELTERQPIENLTETRRLIAALQGLGIRMAIDDVGTGHSGLSYILKLGVDIIKIDKMFIDAIGVERSSAAIIETLIDLAHNMRMEVIAEGVETFEQVVYLRDRGIRAAQGFVFAPPLPGASFLQLLEAIDPIAASDVTPQRTPDPAAPGARPAAA